jgi:hypothetical protein
MYKWHGPYGGNVKMDDHTKGVMRSVRLERRALAATRNEQHTQGKSCDSPTCPYRPGGPKYRDPKKAAEPVDAGQVQRGGDTSERPGRTTRKRQTSAEGADTGGKKKRKTAKQARAASRGES